MATGRSGGALGRAPGEALRAVLGKVWGSWLVGWPLVAWSDGWFWLVGLLAGWLAGGLVGPLTFVCHQGSQMFARAKFFGEAHGELRNPFRFT